MPSRTGPGVIPFFSLVALFELNSTGREELGAQTQRTNGELIILGLNSFNEINITDGTMFSSMGVCVCVFADEARSVLFAILRHSFKRRGGNYD